MTDFFFRLTPDWVLRAVEAGGFRPTGHCSPLVCLENRVYDVRLEDGSHVVAKFYRPGRWGPEAIREEHGFLADLRAAEIPVCAPLPFADGETLHEVEGIHYAVWRRTGGRAPDEFRDEELELLGRLLARIHNAGAAGDAPHRPRSNEMLHRRHAARKNLIRSDPDWALQRTRRIVVHGQPRSPPRESPRQPPSTGLLPWGPPSGLQPKVAVRFRHAVPAH